MHVPSFKQELIVQSLILLSQIVPLKPVPVQLHVKAYKTGGKKSIIKTFVLKKREIKKYN